MGQYFLCCNICYNLYCDNYVSNLCFFCENITNIIHYNKMNLDPTVFIYTDYILKIKYKTIIDDKCIKCKINNTMDIDEKEYFTKLYLVLNIITNNDTIYDEIDTRINLDCESLQYYSIPKRIYDDNSDCLHGVEYKIISAKICQKNNRIILNT
jgi:hypothetical protein